MTTQHAVRPSRSYLLGAMHDGTVRAHTLRISQKEIAYVEFLAGMIRELGGHAWTYREGKRRHLYVVEFSKSLLRSFQPSSRQDHVDYLRGYFDAEGGIPSSPRSEPYIYLAQKNRADLDSARHMLTSLGIVCGKLHNPSRSVDPAYWRFYVRRQSLARFARIVGSYHPRKAPLLTAMADAFV